MEQTLEQLLDAAVDEFPPQAVTAELLQGCMVVSSSGADIGEIEDIVVDMHSGNVSHVVLSSGDWVNSHSIAVPWKNLYFDSAGARFLLRTNDEERVPARGSSMR
jgi:sporulation protein YlmC with PRC-barrel domain